MTFIYFLCPTNNAPVPYFQPHLQYQIIWVSSPKWLPVYCLSTQMHSQRIEEYKSLRDELTKLQVQVDALMDKELEPRVYIKPSDPDIGRRQAENEASEINKWNMYTANR